MLRRLNRTLIPNIKRTPKHNPRNLEMDAVNERSLVISKGKKRADCWKCVIVLQLAL